MRVFNLTVVVFVMIFFSNCATIVSRSSYPIRIDSYPKDAHVTIINRKNIEIFNGITPAQISLKPSAGFFLKAKYTIKFSKPGYSDKSIEIQSDLNGWYFGNVIFGGLVGLLIVDPATGAMYKLNVTDISESLQPETKDITSLQVKSLQIFDLQQIPSEWKGNLELITPK